MKLLLLITLVIGVSAHSFAQKPDSTRAKPASFTNVPQNDYKTFQPTNQLNQIIGSGTYTMVNTIDNRYEGVRGTPYFLPEWNKGQIEVVSGQHYRDVPIKFDAQRQQLILLRRQVNNDSIIVNAEQVKSFQFVDNPGQFYLFRRYPAAKLPDASLKDAYFLVLYQGKSSLLKRIVKTLKQADYKNPYSSDIRYDEYQTAVSYYLLRPDQTIMKVKLSDKALFDAFSDHKDALKEFAKQAGLNLKTEKDAIALIQHSDKL